MRRTHYLQAVYLHIYLYLNRHFKAQINTKSFIKYIVFAKDCYLGLWTPIPRWIIQIKDFYQKTWLKYIRPSLIV
jgi:hypothetical protein